MNEVFIQINGFSLSSVDPELKYQVYLQILTTSCIYCIWTKYLNCESIDNIELCHKMNTIRQL